MKINIFIILILFATNILAAPAQPGIKTFTQANGQTFSAELKGDEYFSWMVDNMDRVIQYNSASTNYEYSLLVETDGDFSLIHSGVVAMDYTPLGISSSTASRAPIIAIDKNKLSQIAQGNRINSDHYLQNLSQSLKLFSLENP